MHANVSNSNSSDFAAFRSRGYFDALDGLRAVSILLVLWHHVPLLTDWPFVPLQENGRYGVSFFFVISGFLICTLFLREQQRTGRIALLRFFGRRALRLLPLYYFVLAVQASLVLTFHLYGPENEILFRNKLPSYLFYYSNWLPTATIGPFFQAWSLAVEEQFYLLFGLLFFTCRPVLIVATVGASLILKFAVYSLFGNVDVESTTWRIIFSYQEPILWGVLIAFVLNSPKGFGFFARWLRSGWVLAGLGGLTLLWLLLDTISTQSSWDAQILYLLMALILMAVVIRPHTPVLEFKALTHVGKISYGIYLLHMFVVSGIKRIPGGDAPVVCFLLSTVLVVGLASLVYRYFEAPIIVYYKRRLASGNKIT